MNAPVFVQPGSEYIVMPTSTNVTLPLKLKFLKGNGDAINTENLIPSSVKPVTVSLIETETIPARKGHFVYRSQPVRARTFTNYMHAKCTIYAYISRT